MTKALFDGCILMAPLPAVLVSVGDFEKPNIITIAWTGVISSKPPRVYISVRPERYSYDILCKKREFVLNLVPKNLTAVADYCGFRSGRDVDKFAEMALTKAQATKIDCPIICESPINIECKVYDILHSGSHDVFLADVLAVQVDEGIVVDGRIDFAKAQLVNYQHGEYYANGKHLGRFGFSVQKKFIRQNGKGKDVNIDGAAYAKRRKKR
ncbi:MAG: flavin reductase [Corallococcus sp.]|nr:flavin reductase [Corallococcus sp.]